MTPDASLPRDRTDEDRAPYSRYAFGYPAPIHRGQGDLFLMTPWGPAILDQGGYPPESEPGYEPRSGGSWLFWRSA